jgi:enoyl-[acyl-carrier protein] reductase III
VRLAGVSPRLNGWSRPVTLATPAPFDLTGRRALVAGGSRGIGCAVASLLARCGARVYINYSRDDASAESTRQRIARDGGTATLVKANLIRPEEVRSLFGAVGEAGGLDILVHAAALGSFKPALDVRANQWDLTLAVSARSFLLCVREAVGLMTAPGGRIVALSSLGSGRAVPAYGAIGAAKAALESLTRSLAVELAPRGIRVNAVSAGPIETESLRLHPAYPALEAQVRQRTPAGRPGTVLDVANVVLFLCSPLADWIVGQTIVADGGLSVTL